jgi:hypothetical protein
LHVKNMGINPAQVKGGKVRRVEVIIKGAEAALQRQREHSLIWRQIS